MRILIVHCHYSIKGGEDSVFNTEVTLLKSKGFNVKKLSFYNFHGFKGGFDFIITPWNFFASKKILKMVDLFQPDIIHFHNIHFSIGPLILRMLSKRSVPIVMTLHNFRFICPSATLFYNGSVFLDSVYSDFPWSAIRKKVYRNSFLQTFWLALVYYFHRRLSTWKNVDAYIALTPFAKDLFLNSKLGLKENQIFVKSNFVSSTPLPVCCRFNHFLFVGRLSEEKGIEMLLESFVRTGCELRIAGDGPLQELVLSVSNKNCNIKYMGRLGPVEIGKEMRECTALVFPSIWYEGMPMTIIEAFSLGTPVIANKLGAMESMIEHGINGLLFNQSSFDLISKLEFWNNLNDFEKDKFSKGAFESYEKNYTPEKNLKMLLSIYESVLDESKKKGN